MPIIVKIILISDICVLILYSFYLKDLNNKHAIEARKLGIATSGSYFTWIDANDPRCPQALRDEIKKAHQKSKLLLVFCLLPFVLFSLSYRYYLHM
jgi:hypothetical protein